MRLKTNSISAWILAGAVVYYLLLPAQAYCQAPYYQGKTIAIVRGGGPGGSGEFQTRALLPYLKKYIPGNPDFVMEFMEGASGRKGANYIYNAKPDGLKIGSAGAMIPGRFSAYPAAITTSTNLFISAPPKPVIPTRFSPEKSWV
jgi:tripartite-type tricarboxylate transporter receptor subunit TctC